MDNLENQSQSDVNQQRPRRKNALSYKECLEIEQEIEREIKKNYQDNVKNKLKVSSFSQLNLNDKIVKK